MNMGSIPEFNGVIFDLDGTLLYTLEEIAFAGNNVLERMGYMPHPVDAFTRFVGSGAKTLALRMLPKTSRTEEQHEKAYVALLAELDAVLNTVARPYDGVLEVLAAYAGAGKKLAVLSNKPDALTQEAVRKLLPGVNFEIVQGGLADIPLKPDPNSALAIARRLNELPANILFVGDSDVDIATACNAGMIAVGACWGFRGKEELAAAGAQVLLQSPSDLLKLLG